MLPPVTAINTGTLTFPLTLTDTSLTLITSTFGVMVLTIARRPSCNEHRPRRCNQHCVADCYEWYW